MKYMKLGSKSDVFQTDGNNIRFVTTDLATDIVITVGDVKFYLHKFPLLSKSSRLQTLVASANEESNDEVDISDIPGGPAAFEVCAKFCYGMVVTLNAYNVLAARCAAEYLEMSETVDRGNLVYKIDVFLSASVFRAWKDSIVVLQSTRPLQAWAGNILKAVRRCVDAVASMAAVDAAEVDWSYTYNRRKNDARWNGVRRQVTVPGDWWVEDLCDLDTCLYKKVVLAIRAKGRTSGAVIGEALRAYACRRLLSSLDSAVSDGLDCTKHCAVLETVVSLLPAEKGSVSCSLLLKLLRAACLLGSVAAYRDDLVGRIGAELDRASISDLLMPASSEDGGMYDVDLIAAMLEEFVRQRTEPKVEEEEEALDAAENLVASVSSAANMAAVAKLMDGCLTEVAKDPSLPVAKFVDLAELVPAASRQVHDALYRAIDMYLNEHPGLSKSERKRLCALVDCKKLTADASAHAVQNERLPLRVVVQVLFFKQLRQQSTAARSVLLPREDGTSCGSSMSAATTATTEDDQWAGVAPTSTSSGEASSLRSVSLAAATRKKKPKNGSKVAPAPAKRMLGKLWSGKASHGENSGSDTSESPAASVNQLEETKSTPARITRHSVS